MTGTETLATYGGIIGGMVIAWLIERYFNIFTMLMAVGIVGCIVFGAIAGFIFTYPLLAYLGIAETGWIWFGPVAGMVGFSAYCFFYRE